MMPLLRNRKALLDSALHLAFLFICITTKRKVKNGKTDDFYRMVGAGNDYTFYFPPDASGAAQRHVAKVVITRPIIGKGQAPNLLIHETAHYTMNANGDVTVDFIERQITCK